MRGSNQTVIIRLGGVRPGWRPATVAGLPLAYPVPRGEPPLGMKTVGNDRENILTIHATTYFGRERERKRESRTGIRNRYYGISETE